MIDDVVVSGEIKIVVDGLSIVVEENAIKELLRDEHILKRLLELNIKERESNFEAEIEAMRAIVYLIEEQEMAEEMARALGERDGGG